MTGIQKETFYKENPETRIGAVIADGQWYFFEKWRSTARVKREELEDWIENHKKEIIIECGIFDDKETKTYRTDVEFIEKWYKDHDTPIDREIIPNNYPPRIWDGKTETQNFLDNPRQYTSKLTIRVKNKKVLNKIKEISENCGYIKYINDKEIEIYCINADYVNRRIRSLINCEDAKISTRRGFYKRKISDFSDKFLQEAYNFYLPFVRNAVRKSKQTIDKFLPDKEDRDVQYIVWINEAMEKYDETLGRPFAGYLDNVLNYWPYNLPVNAMGRELNDFNKVKNEVYSDLVQTTRKTSFTDKEMAENMNLPIDEYKKLDQQYQTWLDISNPASLNTEESNVDKMVSGHIKETSILNDFILANQISLALLKTSIETGDYTNTSEIISHMGLTNIDLKELKIEENFKDKFNKNLRMEMYAGQRKV